MFVRSITQKRIKSLNLAKGMILRYPASGLVLCQKVKGQGHRVTKCKNIMNAIEWPA